MSTIIDLQRRIMESGRIRIGQVVPASNGKTRPAKLDTFRLTSADKLRIEQAAALYGGAVAEWQAPAGKQWEVVTQTSALDVIVPPSDMAFSQHYEIWSAGGCQRRCDGQWEQIGDQACVCDPEARECDIHTRLSVLLRDMPGLGVWRIDSQGWYAAVELGGAVQLIAAAAGRGVLLPARLMLQQRSATRRGPDGKPQTRRFAVPVLDVEVTPRQLLGGMAGVTSIEASQLATLEAPRQPALLQAVPDTVAERPIGSIRDQVMAAQDAKKPRSNAAQPIGDPGLPPGPSELGDPDLSGEEPADDEPLSEEEKQWITLDELLGKQEPSKSDTVPVIDGRLRDLYRLMEAVGLWRPSVDGTDSLHQALRKYPKVAHVSDLTKEPLLTFCKQSWTAARDAVAKAG